MRSLCTVEFRAALIGEIVLEELWRSFESKITNVLAEIRKTSLREVVYLYGCD